MNWMTLTGATLDRRAAEAAQDPPGDGLEGVHIIHPAAPLLAVLEKLGSETLVELAHVRERDQLIIALYIGLGSRVAVIAAPAFAKVEFARWQPAEGPAVRKVANLLQLGDDVEKLVLGHLLAYGAAHLLDPPEPVTRREHIRAGLAVSDVG